MSKKQKFTKTNDKQKQQESKTGYGNKKLEGPDRPST